MNKKLILGAVVVAVGFALACVSNRGDSPVQITGAHPPNEQCQFDDTVQSAGESVNLAGARLLAPDSQAPALNVFTFFELKSELSGETLQAGGRTLADETRNGAYIDQVQLTYRDTSTSPVTLEAESYSIHGYIEPGGSLFTPVDLLPDRAAQRLLDSSSPGTTRTILVEVKFRGYTAGSNATFLTNDVEFPLRVRDSVTPAGSTPFFDQCGGVVGAFAPGSDAGI